MQRLFLCQNISMENTIIKRLISLGETAQKATILYEFYLKNDDIATLERYIEKREEPESVDRNFYQSY